MATTTNTVMVLFFDTLLDGITPTANFTPASGYPLTNLKLPQMVAKCRTPDLTASRLLTWDLGAAKEANAFALVGTNASTKVQGRFVAADDLALTTGMVQSGPSEVDLVDGSLSTTTLYVPVWGRTLLYVHPSSFTKRYIGWYQSDTANPEGYQEWSTARLGLGWQPGVGFQQWRSEPVVVGPVGLRKVLRKHEFTLGFLTRTEAYSIQSIALTSLEAKRLLVIPEPLRLATYGQDVIWCTMSSATIREPILETPPEEKLWRVTLSFTEVDV